jgi:hypothetical protein
MFSAQARLSSVGIDEVAVQNQWLNREQLDWKASFISPPWINQDVLMFLRVFCAKQFLALDSQPRSAFTNELLPPLRSGSTLLWLSCHSTARMCGMKSSCRNR